MPLLLVQITFKNGISPTTARTDIFMRGIGFSHYITNFNNERITVPSMWYCMEYDGRPVADLSQVIQAELDTYLSDYDLLISVIVKFAGKLTGKVVKDS